MPKNRKCICTMHVCNIERHLLQFVRFYGLGFGVNLFENGRKKEIWKQEIQYFILNIKQQNKNSWKFQCVSKIKNKITRGSSSISALYLLMFFLPNYRDRARTLATHCTICQIVSRLHLVSKTPSILEHSEGTLITTQNRNFNTGNLHIHLLTSSFKLFNFELNFPQVKTETNWIFHSDTNNFLKFSSFIIKLRIYTYMYMYIKILQN